MIPMWSFTCANTETHKHVTDYRVYSVRVAVVIFYNLILYNIIIETT